MPSLKSRATISKMNLAIEKSLPTNHAEEQEPGQYSTTPSLPFLSLTVSKYKADKFLRTSIQKHQSRPGLRFATQDIHFC